MAVDHGDVLEVVVRYSWGGLYYLINAFRFVYLHTSSRTETQCLADFKPWTDTLYGQLDDCLTTNIAIAKPLINEVYPTPRWIGETATTARSGIRGANPLPIGACAAITCYSNVSRKRGTYRFSGVYIGDQNAGVLSTAYMIELNQLAQALVFGWTDPGTGMNYRRVFYNWRDHSWTTITGVQARPSVSYLRRRRPRD